MHNSFHYTDSWSVKGVPWSIFFVIECDSHWQAMCIESHIKCMKSKTYIKNLAKYPEMVAKLKAKYPF